MYLIELPADEVVITATVNGTTYAMSNNNGTSSAPTATAVTVSSTTLSTTDTALLWNVLNLGGNLIIYPNGTTEKWLYCINDNNGVRVGGTNANRIFQIDSTGYLKNIKTTATRYLGVYNNADWRCYTSTTGTSNIANQTFAFYVKAATYTGYTTSPATSTQLTGDIIASLVSDEAQMVAGDYYLLIAYDSTNSTLYAASNTPNQNNLGVVSLDTTLSERPEIVKIPSTTVQNIYTFVLEGSSGAWKLKDGLDVYLYKSPIVATNGLSNILRMSNWSYTTTGNPEIATGADEWSLVFPWENVQDVRTGLVNNKYTTYHIRLNHNAAGSPIFSAYTTYTHNPAYLYHVDTVPLTVNIRCGEGEAYVMKNGVVIASTNTPGAPDQTYVGEGDTITLVMKPGDGYRLATAEKGSNRIYDEAVAPAGADTWKWSETYDAYIFEHTITNTENNPTDYSSNYYNVSFLPRRLDTGITAVQAKTVEDGLYVITGVPSDQNTAPDADTSSNQHDASSTYLLFGDDGLVGNVVGRKSASIRLSDINVTLSNSTPYLMTGLNEACLYELEKQANGYYTIRMCGATTNLYLTCTGNDSTKLEATALDTFTDSAYWTITIDSNGVAKIQNKAQPTRYLKFMGDGNYQFRTYEESTKGSVWPILYKASQTGYIVSYGKEGSGTVKAYNDTTETDVVSGSVQNAGSEIRFTFTPATNYELNYITLTKNDGSTETISAGALTYDIYTGSYSYTYPGKDDAGLDQHITVTAFFKKISSAVTVVYYVNNEAQSSKEVDLDGAYYYIDLTPTVTVEGKSYTYADLSFDKAVNGEAQFTDVNEPIPVTSGDTVRLYFLTTAVSMSKTASETTKFVSSAENPMTLGGTTAGSKAFTDKNGQDAYDNVKQTFRIELDVNSTDMIKGYSKGGNTDIILVLDDSNSMFPKYSENAESTKGAVAQFLSVAFNGNTGNKVAVVQYNSLASAWNGSKFVEYSGSMSGYTTLTYSNCFMDTADKVSAAVEAALTQDSANGGTNTMGGYKMAEVVAKTRKSDTTRDLVILLFTDGEPTFRYSSGTTVSYDYDGTTTSEYEYNEALAAGQSLRTAVDSYSGCSSYIYSVALLNESTYTQQDYDLVENLMGTSPKKFISDAASGYYVYTIRGRVDTASNWESATAYSNAYFPIKGDTSTDITQQLTDIFEQIAYTTVPDKYLTGTLVDTIPANFKLTDESKTALTTAGWTITENADGTTTLSKSGVVADDKTADDGEELPKDLSYEVVYQGGGHGAVYTNTAATYTYTDILTGTEVVGTFVKPAVEVIPWTVDDHATAVLQTDLSINIKANDLFSELTAGGYTVVDYKIRLTDSNGADKEYYDAVEQLGCKFDAVLDESSQTVNFFTLTGGTHVFYYVVETTVRAPDGTFETVYSRVTKVDVTVPNVDLTKTAQEVTDNSTYTAYVENKDGLSMTDQYGNTYQLYLITLSIAKQNASDTIKEGVLTDVIPEGFTFVSFVNAPANASHQDGKITYSGISGDTSLRFLVLYTGGDSGVLYTNTSASFSYQFVVDDTTTLNMSQYFPQPVAGINPATVNDVDVVKSGDTQTINVLANDLFTHTGLTLSDYTVSDKTVYLTDADGNKLSEEELSALDLKPEEKDANGRYYLLNSDGNRITYEYETGKTADVYMKELTITSDTLAESQTGRAFYYDVDTDGDGEVEAVALTAAQLRKLDIVCYDSTYEAIGPENEIYLKNGQGLAFDVPNGASVQISAKVPYGGSAQIWAYKNGWIEAAVVVNSRTEMYYDMSNYVSGGKFILKCVATDTTTVLSLCNAKGIGVTRGASLMTITSGTVRAAVDAFDDPKEHVHSYTDVVTAPTCTEQGYTTHTCECGDSFVDSYVDALGHAWGKAVVTQEPTATQDGVRTYTCVRCGETKTEPIPATGETEKPCDGGEGCPSAEFTDISTKAWYHLSVDYAVTHGLMDGVGNGLFAPEEDMTRAMLVTVLWRFEGKPEAGKSPFTDVPEGEWYTEAVAWAAENGIVDGIGGGRFDPDGKITREQMATILYRYAKKNGMDTEKRDELSGYPDAEKVSAYAEEAVKWTVAEAIINGSDGTLLPQSAATRAQVATILVRFIENIAKQ